MDTLYTTSTTTDNSEQLDRKRSFSLVSDGEADHIESDSKRLSVNEDKKWKRVMANRISAKESRERRKQLLNNLEGSVQTLMRENAVLTAENRELRKHLALLFPQSRANISLLSQALHIQLPVLRPDVIQRSPCLDLMHGRASSDLHARSFIPTVLDSLSLQRANNNAGLLKHQMKLFGFDA